MLCSIFAPIGCVLQEMQECFEQKDIQMLQEVIGKMDKTEAEYHIKRCVDSGMIPFVC